MCTVLLAVSPGEEFPFVLLGTRDEFVDRSWDPPAAHWGDRPELVGGRDREAGGTWLAVHRSRNGMSVVLNRWDAAEPAGGNAGSYPASRGELPLLAADPAVGGAAPAVPYERARRTRPFNLLTASTAGASHLSWDGTSLTHQQVEPGVHILGAGDMDESGDSRAQRWLPPLSQLAVPEPHASSPPDEAWQPWLGLLAESTKEYPPEAAPALVRRHLIGRRVHATLAVCAVALGPHGPRFDFAPLPEPGALPDDLPWTRPV